VIWKTQIPEHLTVDKCKLNEGKSKTTAQADSEAWTNDRKYRLTASNYGHIMNIRRNHLMHPGTEHVALFHLLIHIVRKSAPRFTRFPSLVLIRLVLTEIQRFKNVKINKEMYGIWTLCQTVSGWPYISL